MVFEIKNNQFSFSPLKAITFAQLIFYHENHNHSCNRIDLQQFIHDFCLVRAFEKYENQPLVYCSAVELGNCLV